MSTITYTIATEAGHVFAQGMLFAKTFTSGNDGYFSNDKTAMPKVAHLTGKPIVMTLKDGDRIMGTFTAYSRTFSSGSYGFWAGGKMYTNDGIECQAQMQLVLVKSKGVAKDALNTCGNKYQLQAQAVFLNGVKHSLNVGDDANTEAITDALNAQ